MKINKLNLEYNIQGVLEINGSITFNTKKEYNKWRKKYNPQPNLLTSSPHALTSIPTLATIPDENSYKTHQTQGYFAKNGIRPVKLVEKNELSKIGKN